LRSADHGCTVGALLRLRATMYDLIIVGGGPAGLTAAVYALHKRVETLLICEDLGGNVNYHLKLKGFDGHEIVTGADVVEKFRRQLKYLRFAHRLTMSLRSSHKRRIYCADLKRRALQNACGGYRYWGHSAAG
jgi:thioredoxin reductase